MNTEHDFPDDWGDVGTLWQTQATGQVDIDRLRRAAAVRTSRLIALTVVEVASFAVSLFVLLRLIGAKPNLGPVHWITLGLLAIAGAFTAWTIGSRRGLWRHHGLGPEALVRLEIDRANASIRFWRMNRFVLFIVLGGVALLTAGWLTGWIDPPKRNLWWLPAAANLPLVAVSLLVERWRVRQLRKRLGQLIGLKAALEQ
ncbi:MAG: hypothetical protein AVDCRST_MAG71-2709 [uncultured Lysobacter sp.]|uniref:Transmembrane protein n=1 Tax=uncultured Lysobacter sp. TaxID=271060 RepID=A0A6J4M4K6_9GAMM|nr:MAG: hypothetical protein AVDCRST_MAG71-2709 [uncultured Lysobacter sp.]